LYWVDILNKIAKATELSYTELKALKVKEFFLIVTNVDNA